MKHDSSGHLRRDVIRRFGAALGAPSLIPLVGCADDVTTGQSATIPEGLTQSGVVRRATSAYALQIASVTYVAPLQVGTSA